MLGMLGKLGSLGRLGWLGRLGKLGQVGVCQTKNPKQRWVQQLVLNNMPSKVGKNHFVEIELFKDRTSNWQKITSFKIS